MTKEKKTIEIMIKVYCDGHHTESDGLCEDCRELLDYARLRLGRCPFGENKPACSKCPVHCYKPSMRARIMSVMKYSGPRMLYVHPGLALRHLLTRSGPFNRGRTHKSLERR